VRRKRFVIVLVKGEWQVTLGSNLHGVYLTRKEAVDAAIRAARQIDGAEVIVGSGGGTFETVWPV
jgi:thiamine monophosphate synthase